jgi:hypothetical protein
MTFIGPLPYTIQNGQAIDAVPVMANFNRIVDDTNTALAANIPSSQVIYTSPASGAVSRTLLDKMQDVVSVKDFGATGDGATDDTAAVQAAVNYLNGVGGGRLYFPRGTYLTGKITVYSNLWLCGDGRSNTTIKLTSGANTDLIYSSGADSLWGTGSSAGIQNFGLFDLTLDGNRAGNLSAGSCVALYGEGFYFQNLSVINARDYGIRTEWGDGAPLFGMESHYVDVKIDGAGKDGWLNNGPHDSVTFGLIVIDASLNADKTWNGLVCGSSCSSRFVGIHVWNRSSSNRHAYALKLVGGGNEFVASHFEGAWNANVGIFSSNNVFDDSCRYYSAWNGTNIFLGLTATCNVIRGFLDISGAGRPDCVGVVLGSLASDYISDNVIDIYSKEQRAGDVSFTYSDGNNKVRVRGYKASGPIVVGTPLVRDSVDAEVNINGTQTVVNTEVQSATISIGANANATWTFPFQFASAPVVTFSPASPSGSITSGIWISSLGASSVTFYNNNSVSMTLHITARQT